MGTKDRRFAKILVFGVCFYVALLSGTFGQNLISKATYLASNTDRARNIDIRLRADKESVRQGDIIRLTVVTDQDCYLTVVYPSPSGRAVILWPNRGSGPDNRVQAGQSVSIPGPNAEFQLKVDGTCPFERIEAYAFNMKNAILRERDFRPQTGGCVMEFVGTAEDLARTFNTQIRRLPPGVRWGTAQLTIPVAGAGNTGEAPLPDQPPSEAKFAPSRQVEEEISTLNTEIRNKRIGWLAGWTSVSHLSEDEFAMMCGAREEDPPGPESGDLGESYPMFLDRSEDMAEKLPASWNWSDIRGKNWMTPVRDQKGCGSCVSFGTLAAIEANYQIRTQNPASGVDLSEAHLFFCGCGKCCGSGWKAEKALTWLKSQSVEEEASFPYQPKDQECEPGKCNTTAKKKISVQGFRRLVKPEEAKNWLRNVGPLVGSMDVYADFRHYKGGAEPYKPVNTKKIGGHCICIVGYSDNEKCWFVKNSFGTGWGEKGYLKIAYDQCRMLTKARPFFGIGKILIKPK